MNFDTDTHAPIILLDALIENLATARSLAEVIKEELERKLDEFERRPDVKAARLDLDNLQGQMFDLERSIRLEAMRRYTQTGNHKPHKAITVKLDRESLKALIDEDLSKYVPSFVPEKVGTYSLPTKAGKG